MNEMEINRGVVMVREVAVMREYGGALLICLALMFMNPIVYVYGLNIGAEATGFGVYLQEQECSRTCESRFCSVAPFLRYGKYCGLLYSGCPGETPCDALDACCMKHDQCVADTNKGYLSKECSKRLVECMNKYRKSGGGRRKTTFEGNTCQVEDVVHVILNVMKAALFAARLLHRP